MVFDKLKIIITSKNQASHLQLREILSNLNLSCLNTPQGTRLEIFIDSLFDLSVAEKFIQKSVLDNINYHLFFAEINRFSLPYLQEVKAIQKLDPDLFIIIVSSSTQHWHEVIRFLGLNGRILFLKTPFNVQETLLAAQNIIHERVLRQFFNHHLCQQLQLSKEVEVSPGSGSDSNLAIFEGIHFEEKLNQILSMGYVEHSDTGLVCISLEGATPVGGGTIEYINESLFNAIKERLQYHIAEGWVLGDWGQGRLGIIIPRVFDHKVCKKQLLSLYGKLTEAYEIYGAKLIISISIGVAFSEAVVTSAIKLTAHAQSAVRITSPQKKVHIAFYNIQEEQKKIHSLLLESDLKKAIRNDEFEVFFQPLINIKQNRVSTVEVLTRWRHPSLGLLSPGEFLVLAEEANLLTALNELVINKALAQASPWVRYEIKIALNIPVRHLLSENFVETMNLVCQKHNVPADAIELEVTEEQALEQSLEVIEVIHKIKHYGYHVVLDDFGVGYSSLHYLSSFPVDKVKIDRSFLHVNSPKQNNIIKAILQLCQKLNISSVCEGVEEYKQFIFLSGTECDEIQGFLFSRPIGQAHVEPFIKSFSLDTFFAGMQQHG